MSTAFQILHGSIIGGTGALLSYWAGWRARGEITRAEWEAMHTSFVEVRTQRGNGNGGPTTSKPQPAGGRLIRQARRKPFAF